MIAAGTTVDGYRVERMIGRGGMGVVYEAVQTSVNRRVALKVLRPEIADDPEFVARFRREARLQASLEHPNVLEVYDVGESDEGLFLAMRLVSGRTLLDLLRDGELDASRALNLLDQVTGALDVAHDASLIHRDIKPQNVLMGEGDRAFLADFGLTRGGTDTTIASSSPLLGSVAYVAPEIVRGEEPTPASDRYSVAATLFHCLTGDVVFPRGSDAAVLYAHATEAPPPVRDRRGELPIELDEVMESALAKQPDARPPTAQAIVHAAREALGPTAAGLGPPRLGKPPALSPAPAPAPRPAQRSARARLAIAGGVLLGAVALGAGAALLLSDPDAAADEVTVTPVPAGATALGSDLAAPERSADCRGETATAGSPSCSIVQSELPGATLLVPEDGTIVGWGVRGASGELALDVIRPRGDDTLRVVRSQWESAGNSAPHYFKTSLPVEVGDQIGVELGTGASIGVSAADGATTLRWLRPLGGLYGSPDLDAGSGLDYELALRADFVPGERDVGRFPRLVFDEAASAPDGHVREAGFLNIDEPEPKRMRVELVELKDRVALDLSRGDRRTLRIFMPGLEPKGVPVELETADIPGTRTGGAAVWWTNPNSGRAIFHGFVIGEGRVVHAH